MPSGQAGKVWPWLLTLLLCLAAGAGFWLWSSQEQAGPAVSPPASGAAGQGGRRSAGVKGVQPVSVQPARRQDVRVTVNAIGSIAASNTAIVRAQVSGVLQTLNFKEGEQVKAGQLLAQIDPRAFEANLGQAEGALARDRAQLDNARIDLLRYRDLLAKDAIAKQQLDTQEALVRQFEGTVKLDQAAVASARLQASYSRVSAPIAGRAGLKQVDLGNVIQPTDANGVVVITQTRPIALVFAVPSANLPRITARLKQNQALPVEAWDRDGKTRLAEGRVAMVDNAIDPTTDTIKVKALFANADDALFPNQAVGVRLQLDQLADVLTVPKAAVLRGAQGFYVYVVNADNTVNTRVLKPGPVDGDSMAVEGALQEGEQVVIDGVDRLRDGAKVEVIATDPKQRVGANTTGRKRGAGAWENGVSAAPNADAGKAGRPNAAASDATAGERPRRMEGLPAEVAEKLKTMSQEERRAWFKKRREESGKPGDPAN